jgi:hypothetical protein
MKIQARDVGQFPRIIEVSAYACRKPKGTGHRGRTWDTFGKVIVDGKEYRAVCDTTWGTYAYFEKDGKWYKFRFV